MIDKLASKHLHRPTAPHNGLFFDTKNATVNTLILRIQKPVGDITVIMSTFYTIYV